MSCSAPWGLQLSLFLLTVQSFRMEARGLPEARSQVPAIKRRSCLQEMENRSQTGVSPRERVDWSGWKSREVCTSDSKPASVCLHSEMGLYLTVAKWLPEARFTAAGLQTSAVAES
jgi:hypothetical protein